MALTVPPPPLRMVQTRPLPRDMYRDSGFKYLLRCIESIVLSVFIQLDGARHVLIVQTHSQHLHTQYKHKSFVFLFTYMYVHTIIHYNENKNLVHESGSILTYTNIYFSMKDYKLQHWFQFHGTRSYINFVKPLSLQFRKITIKIIVF